MKKQAFLLILTLTLFAGKVAASYTDDLIPVTPTVTIQLGSNKDQSICLSTPMTSIVYDLTHADQVVLTAVPSLPAWVVGTWAGGANGTFTITGTPNVSGTFTYTITVTNLPSGDVASTTGTITVNVLPTLTGASQASTVCPGSGATIDLTGLLASSTSTVAYSINSVAQTAVTNVIANGSGTASFTSANLTAANNGQTLRITGITTTSVTPNCSAVFTQDVTLSVNPSPTLTGASQSASVCDGFGATINLTGLLASSTSTVAYSINSVAQTAITNVVANGAGAASFTSANLTAANNGQTLRITGITTTSTTPNCTGTFTQDVVLSVDPLPAAITGTTSVCAGSTTTLSDATPLGTWSSATGGVATVNLTTGVVTGVSAGTSVITYTITATGCLTTTTVTVRPIPTASISGTTVVCQNAVAPDITFTNPQAYPVTVTYDINLGSSLTVNIGASTTATVAAPTGTAGTFDYNLESIDYQSGTTCSNTISGTATITVDPLPAAISGTTSVCVASTTTLSDATPLGTWSSATPSVATVDPATGVVTGVSAGTSVITYTITATGCLVTTTVTVRPIPTASISGTTEICQNAVAPDITFTNPQAYPVTVTYNINGAASTTINIGASTTATISVVTGTAGSFIYTLESVDYQSGTTCSNTISGSATVTIDPLPAAITGLSNVCEGSTITLSDATLLGTWSSATPGVATVDPATGVVTGVSAGTSVISYIITVTGCLVTTTVTVDPLPAVITGTTIVCVGSTTTLSDATGGGNWNSASPGVATISGGGVVSGFLPGTSVISYTLPATSCYVTTTVTVRPAPTASVSGTTEVCKNAAAPDITFTNPQTYPVTVTYNINLGSSQTVNIGASTTATVSAPTGTAGTFDYNLESVDYQSGTTCSNAISGTATVTVDPLPAAITGTTTVCESSSTTLSDATPLGTWGSATGAVATVDPSTGVVSGVSAGTSVITYTITLTGCLTTTTVTVTAKPILASLDATKCSDVALGFNLDVAGGSVPAANYNIITITADPGLAASAGSPAPGAGLAASVISDDAWTNTTAGALNVVYTIRPVGTNGCVGDPYTMTITVNPEPVGVSTPSSQTVCSDETITPIVLTTSNGMNAVTTYAWTRNNTANVTNLANSGTGDISGTPNNVTGSDQTVTYTITPTSSAGCDGNTFTATVIVRSEPVGVSTPSSQTVCSDETITPIVLTTSNGMNAVTTYAWTRDNTTNVTGIANSGSGDISGAPDNVTGVNQTITYTITPTSSAGCVGNTFTATIIVRSEPVGVSTPSSQTVCSDETITPIVLTTSNSMNAGTTYAWTRDNTINVTGIANSGTGDISGAPDNVTGVNQTITYTITPTSSFGCAGNTFTATVIVRSEPVGVSTPSSQTVCSDETITPIVLTTSNGMDVVTTYAWTRNNTANVTNLANSGSGDISGTPNNVTGVNQTVTYTITPTSSAGCVGNTFTATVIVRSEPVGVSTPSSQTVCSDETITPIVLTTSNGMNAVTTYAWTRDNTTNVTGIANSGSGDISGAPDNVTGVNQTITYTITPTSSAGCVGNTFTAIIIVRSEPVGVSTPSSQTVCSDETITPIVLTTSNGMDAITSYAWTRNNTANVTNLGNSGAGDISGTPNNVTGVNQTVTYTITPTSSAGCAGNTFTATVIVRSEPVGVSTPSSQTVCSDETITPIVLTTSNGMNAITTYAWTRDNTTNVTNLANSGSGDISGTPNNVTGVNQTVTYTITPTSSAGCVGNTFTATIIVKPEPVGSDAVVTICSGNTLNFSLQGNINGNNSVTSVFTYTVTSSDPGNVAPAADRTSGTNAPITDSYVNTTSAPVYITYTITPKSNPGGCTGNIFTYTVRVNPLPKLTGASQSAIVCEPSAVTINLLGLLPSTTSTVDYTIIGVGVQPSATGVVSDINGAAHFTTASLDAATYNGKILRVTGITTSSYSPTCTITTFTQDVALIVNPATAGGTITSAQTTICLGASPADLVLGGSVGSVVKWQKSPVANFATYTDIPVTSTTLTGVTIGNLTANTYFQAVVQSGNCTPTNSASILISVNPLPVPTFTAGPATVNVTSTGNIYTTQAGMNSYSWAVSAGGAITAGGGATDNSVTVTWNTAGAQTVSVNYTNPGTGCTAAAATVFNVAVNATPVASNVTILGDPRSGMTLNASYVYSDADNDAQGTSVFQWYTGTSSAGAGSTAITSATAITYKLKDVDTTFYIGFSVIPVALTGATPGSKVTTVTWVGKVKNDRPVATAGAITGSLNVGGTITGHYTYSDTEGDIESGSTYQWYSSSTLAGTYTLIAGETSITHVIGSGEQGNYFKFHVKPYAVTGNSPGTEVSSAGYGPANTKPSASGVNITGTVAIGSTLTGNYTYSDVNSDVEGVSTFKWFRNGVEISGSTSKTYVIVSTDEGYKFSFQVTPVSATGVPATGDPVTSPQTVAVPVSTSVPVVSQICIEGIRATGNVIKGKYLFTYNPSDDNSVYRWMRDNDTISGATSITYTLTSADIDHDIYFVVYPYSALPAHKRGVTVKSNSLARIILTQLSYSLADPAFTLVPNVTGGVFSGKGVSNGSFSPANADTASIPPHNVNYLLNIVNTSTSCSQQANVSIIVVAIKANFVGLNPIYCFDGKRDTIAVANLPISVLPDTATVTNRKFWSSNPASIVGSLIPNKIIIDPGKMRHKIYTDTLYFSYNYKGSYFPISQVYQTDSVGVASINNLHSGDIFCNNDAPFTLFPSLVGSGGVFVGPVTLTVTGSTLFDPSKGINDTSVVFTYTHVNSAGCFSKIRVPIRINPAAKVSFKPIAVCVVSNADTIKFNNYTTSADAIKTWLWEFSDAGGSSTNGLKSPGYLYKIGGDHKVTLTATTIKDCSTTKDTTIGIGFKPVTDFYWKNECYHPNDSIMFFDSTSSTATILSRTWKFGALPVVKTAAGDVYKNIKFVKSDSGYLSVKYIVRTSYTNCNDSITKLIYIRPTIPITTADYIQNFETGKVGWVKDYESLNNWSFGKPNRAVIKTAASGTKAWFTAYDTLHQKVESSSIISPCFDFTAIQRPMISMKLFKRFDLNRDGASLQYKIKDSTWVNVGTLNDGINWYNSSIIKGKPGGDPIGWTTGTSGQDIAWGESRHTLDALSGKKDVKFRIVYGSDGTGAANEGIAFDDIRIGTRTRKVLFEHFTNLSTKASSNSNTTVTGLASRMKTDVINIQYHTNFPGTDAYYNDNPGDASARFLFYGLSKAPYSFIDGGTKTNYANVSDYLSIALDTNDLTRRSLTDPSFAITLNSTITGSIITVNGQIKALAAINSENVTLYLVVTEKKDTKQTGANGEKIFYNVFRKLIPDAGGISLNKVWAKNETLTLPDKTWAIDKIPNASDVEVIAFIQNNITKEIYQAESNVKLGIVVGIENVLANNGKGFSLYPNPASNRLTIAFEKSLDAETEIMIYDFKGTVVHTYKAGSGQSEFSINDIDLQNGMYLVRIKSGGLDWGFKKLIISKY